MAVLFVSDLHLDSARGEAIVSFIDFLATEASDAEKLFILGDLFEVWIGDDDDDPSANQVMDALTRLTRTGVSTYLMHGNRDFLIGERFADRTGCRILPDYSTFDIDGKLTLLTHGDLLCTDDVPYLRFRATTRNPDWQTDFLSKPLAERRKIARTMREVSQSETAAKPTEIMDVNQDAVEKVMREHKVRYLVHGHTHRPAVHRFELDGDDATRIVLGDWYQRGSVLRWDPSGFSLSEWDLEARRS